MSQSPSRVVSPTRAELEARVAGKQLAKDSEVDLGETSVKRERSASQNKGDLIIETKRKEPTVSGRGLRKTAPRGRTRSYGAQRSYSSTSSSSSSARSTRSRVRTGEAKLFEGELPYYRRTKEVKEVELEEIPLSEDQA